MKSLLLKWLVNAISLFVVINVVPGIYMEQWQALLAGALVIGLLNAFLKPILLFLTLPVNIVSLGLFTLVLNGGLFYLAAWLVKGFHVTGFWAAFIAALIFSIVSSLLNLVIGPKGR